MLCLVLLGLQRFVVPLRGVVTTLRRIFSHVRVQGRLFLSYCVVLTLVACQKIEMGCLNPMNDGVSFRKIVVTKIRYNIAISSS